MPDTTRIFLSGGHKVDVQEQPSEVSDHLTSPQPAIASPTMPPLKFCGTVKAWP